MSVTILVRSAPEGRVEDADSELTLTFDSPRLVIGRGEGADVRLPDPSVSARHASLRARGAEWVLLDEGSTNGTRMGGVLLSPHSPRVVRSGERVRVGRVWLELRMGASSTTSGPGAALRVALTLVTRALDSEGESARPRIEAAGKKLELAEDGRAYVIGRARESDLALEPEGVARRHAQVTVEGARVMVQDLGGSGGTLLGGEALGARPAHWKPGQALRVGECTVELAHPALEALAELERSPDERMRSEELTEPAPSSALEQPEAETTPETPPVDAGLLADQEEDDGPIVRRRPGWSSTDAAVLLLAAGVLVLSIAALFWLFKR